MIRFGHYKRNVLENGSHKNEKGIAGTQKLINIIQCHPSVPVAEIYTSSGIGGCAFGFSLNPEIGR